MAKDKAAKERKREEKKKQARLRTEASRVAKRRQEALIVEALTVGGTKGMAAVFSTDHRSHRPVPPPPHYAEFEALLGSAVPGKLTWRKILQTLGGALQVGSGGASLGAVVTWAPNQLMRISPLPSVLLRCAADPARWFVRTIQATREDAEWAFWIAPLYTSVDETSLMVVGWKPCGNVAAWLVDPDDHSWYPVTQPDKFLLSNSPLEANNVPPDEQIKGDDFAFWLILRALEVHIPSDAKLSIDDPLVCKAVDILIESQAVLLVTVFELARTQYASEEYIDKLWEENEAISALEREADSLRRRLTADQEELQRAKSDLIRVRATQMDKPSTPTAEPTSLAQRLEVVFS